MRLTMQQQAQQIEQMRQQQTIHPTAVPPSTAAVFGGDETLESFLRNIGALPQMLSPPVLF